MLARLLAMAMVFGGCSYEGVPSTEKRSSPPEERDEVFNSPSKRKTDSSSHSVETLSGDGSNSRPRNEDTGGAPGDSESENEDGVEEEELNESAQSLIGSFLLKGPKGPLSRESEISWEPAEGATSYVVSFTPAKDCSIAVWSAKTAANQLLLKDAPPGAHFLCVHAVKDSSKKQAENNGIEVLVKSGWERLTNPGLTSRMGGATVWTGKEVIVWGGATSNQGFGPSDGTTLTYAEAWDPSTGAIRILPFPATVVPTRYASMVWTGSYALIWGGGQNIGPAGLRGDLPIERGYKWDPIANTYELLPTENGPGASRHSPVAWTGTEMLVYGSAPLPNGLATAVIRFRAFNPATGVWRVLPVDKYAGFNNGIWTGSDLLLPELGLAFSPANMNYAQRSKQDWYSSVMASYVWTGNRVIYWGGGVSGVTDEGRFYDPKLDKWTPMPRLGEVPAPRWLHQAVWVQNRMYVFGGAVGGIAGTSPEMFVFWP